MVDPDQAGPTSAQADQLIATVSNLSNRIKHTRRLTRLLAASLVLDVLFTLILGFGFGRVNDVSRDAKQASAAAAAAAQVAADVAANNARIIHDNCLNTNKVRAESVRLWHDLLATSPNLTPEARDQVMATVNNAYKPSDCGP